jgi:hypothetical protein
MRTRFLPLLPACLLAFAVGCGGADEDAAPPSRAEPLTAAELGWVREYSSWTIDVYDEELGPEPGPALVRECRTRLEEVGAPPSERLEPAAARAAAVCPLLGRPGSVRRALDAVDDADDLVLPLFLDSRKLVLSSGVTSGSRADVDLSAVASERAETAAEVRCWAPADWRRVVREDNAWSDVSDDPNELYGWQDDDTSRIHMRLDQCNELARLRREDLLERSHDRQVDAADSVGTLAHEIQHFLVPDGDEDDVECAALDTQASVALDLGATQDEADVLAGIYRDEIYPELPDEYVGGGCGE